jgi:Fe2+ or Zn2+ uptake regulation protein
MRLSTSRGKRGGAERRNVLLAALRNIDGWMTSRELSDDLYRGPLTMTWIPPWTVYPDLVRLREQGLVESHHVTSRTIWWRATPEPEGTP